RERQRNTLEQNVGPLVGRVEWLEQLPELPQDGLIIANEILDAFPVKVFKTCAGKIYECRVQLLDNEFAWLDVPADRDLCERVTERISSEIIHRESEYVSELNIGIGPWISDLARVMRSAVALVIDYGYPRSEYYHRQRSTGTLQCYFRHRKHDDPFWNPGLQDITASVDFTSVAEAVERCGLSVLGFAEQASFLMANGLLEEAQARASSADEIVRQRIAHETRILTLPTEMGARFKVFAAGRGYNFPLRGFQLRNDCHRL
ncbi:MAG: SAM-dependent methyltransferase, partial [Gammaproteobacteria bacterium]